KAITLVNTNLRIIPTDKPIFEEFTDDSNGFPFDQNQNSTVLANTPIFISHITRDKSWVFAETSFASGWIKTRDIAYAGPKFIKKFTDHSTLIAITHDEFPIRSFSGNYLFNGYIGMIFPLLKQNKTNYHIITTASTANNYAYTKEAVISKKHAKKMPLPLNIRNLSMICEKLTNKPYGWGGLYNNRDCSAMIKDLYTPFGIWLPRNSTSQAKKGGLFVDISNIQGDIKEEFILNNAIPYLTLLWFPGHIMLYIGEKEGSPIVFHNLWGIRTTDEKKRKIIGKSVITTLYPGNGIENADETGNFLERIKAMTLIAPRY
ncbi:glycoside hydrolase, partial [Candidatus Marinamargulisbacteria bacterium SCGC AG-414-C22]